MKLFLILFLLILGYSKENKIYFIKQNIKKNPPYLKTIKDPIYKIKITRITDFKAFNNSYARHRYSKNQPFNCNSTLIKIQTKWLLDGKNYKIIKKFPKELHYTTSIWSHKNPYLLYIFKDDGNILTYNVKTQKLQNLFKIKSYDRVTLGPNEGNIDINDKYAALACKKREDLEVIILDLQKREIVAKKIFKNKWGKSYNPLFFDWISVSQSGKYTVILWNKKNRNSFSSSKVKVYNTKNLSYRETLYKYGNHGDLCYDSKGEEVYVQFAGKASLNAYRLKDGKNIEILKNRELEIGGARHISCRNYKQKGWCYISTQKHSLILAIKLEKNGDIKYITNHNSTQKTYLKIATPVANPTGTKIIFSSDWRNKNKEVVFDYLVEKTSLGGDLHSHTSKAQYYRR